MAYLIGLRMLGLGDFDDTVAGRLWAVSGRG